MLRTAKRRVRARARHFAVAPPPLLVRGRDRLWARRLSRNVPKLLPVLVLVCSEKVPNCLSTS
eukprot:358189-Hanusia_phi.AAC.1